MHSKKISLPSREVSVFRGHFNGKQREQNFTNWEFLDERSVSNILSVWIIAYVAWYCYCHKFINYDYYDVYLFATITKYYFSSTLVLVKKSFVKWSCNDVYLFKGTTMFIICCDIRLSELATIQKSLFLVYFVVQAPFKCRIDISLNFHWRRAGRESSWDQFLHLGTTVFPRK